MMEEVAKVVAVSNDEITVESAIKSTCSSCQQVEQCGSGQVAKAIPQAKLVVNIPKRFDVKLGDMVIIGIPEGSLLLSAWQVYFLPIFLLIFLAGAGQWLTAAWQLEHEFLVVFLAFLGGYLGFKLAQKLQKKLATAKNLLPRLIRKQPETINIVEI
jgi:sigma-E factor negative regulatory protein RseC